MKLGSKPGLAAGLAVVALATAASTALAGPTVKVRVEGASGTLLERTTVTLPDTPPPVPQQPCPAGSVAAAIEVATAGNWDRSNFTQTILGESHTFTHNDFWAEWVDRGAGYKFGNGVCSDLLNAGDEVLMLVDVPPYGEGSLAEVPLELHADNGVRGQPVTVQVTGAILTDFSQPAHSEPVSGATVSGGGASAVTGADGRATLTFAQTGPMTLKASKPDPVTSGAVTIQVVAPGEPVPPSGGSGSATAPDRLAPL